MLRRIVWAVAGLGVLWAVDSGVASAETRIIVQNNTPFTFSANPTGPQDIRSGAWRIGTTTVLPGRRETVLTFNRDEGITAGKRFRFSTRLRKDGSDLLLLQELRGAAVNSHLWQSLGGPGFEDPWFDDRHTHVATWDANGATIVVLYRAFFTGTDDDVEYILQYAYPPSVGPDDQFSVLAYNVYLRPIFQNGQSIRTGLLPEVLRGYDAIVFSEAFVDDLRRSLIAGIRSEYPHVTPVVGKDSDPEQDGGVFIASRWPIQFDAQETFGSRCAGSDCLSDKGVMYARIQKGSRVYHLFGTHTQAWQTAEGRGTRAAQFRQIKAFIDKQGISPKEPVLIAGDLNVDRRLARDDVTDDEFDDMLRILDAGMPESIGYDASWDPRSNRLAQPTFPATAVDSELPASEYLDYVLWSKAHRAPTTATNEVRILRSSREWKEYAWEYALWDLSDHYPVHGRFEFVDVPRFDHRTYKRYWLYVVRSDGTLVELVHDLTEDARLPEERAPAPRQGWQEVVEQAGSSNVVPAKPLDPGKLRAGANVGVTSIKPSASVAVAGQQTVQVGPRAKPVHESGPELSHRLSSPMVVGSGWQQFRQVIPAAGPGKPLVGPWPVRASDAVREPTPQSSGVALYALTGDGRLLWYRHDGYVDGTMQWRGPVEVQAGWNRYERLIAGGEGVVYGVVPDGTLHWHQHPTAADAAASDPWTPGRVVGSGWQTFTQVFGGGGGVVYAIRPDGTLVWYRHDGYADGSMRWLGPLPIDNGWGAFKRVVSAGEGVIYALTADNRLRCYQHVGWADGAPRWREMAELGRLDDAIDLVAVLPRPVVVK